MKKELFILGLALCPLFSSSSMAQPPDPRDSIIIESKTVNPGVGAPITVVRVYITNKDSLKNITIPLVERTLTGGAYMTLSYPRTYAGVVIPLTTTLQFQKIFAGIRYNSVSPDTFTIAGFYEPLNFPTVEPPNATRKPFYEIKFDSVRSDTGRVLLDSAFIAAGTSRLSPQFVNMASKAVWVNFVKGTITVAPPQDPCLLKKFDIKADGVLNLSDVVTLLNCAFEDNSSCDRPLTPADLVSLLNFIFLATPPPPVEC